MDTLDLVGQWLSEQGMNVQRCEEALGLMSAIRVRGPVVNQESPMSTVVFVVDHGRTALLTGPVWMAELDDPESLPLLLAELQRRL